MEGEVRTKVLHLEDRHNVLRWHLGWRQKENKYPSTNEWDDVDDWAIRFSHFD